MTNETQTETEERLTLDEMIALANKAYGWHYSGNVGGGGDLSVIGHMGHVYGNDIQVSVEITPKLRKYILFGKPILSKIKVGTWNYHRLYNYDFVVSDLGSAVTFDKRVSDLYEILEKEIMADRQKKYERQHPARQREESALQRKITQIRESIREERK